MNNNPSKATTALLLLRIAAYLLAVLLVLLTFAVLCAEDTVTISAAERGVNDLRNFDFTHNIALIPTGDTSVIYPGAFYTSEDFASGKVTQEGNTGSAHGDFGTIHMVLMLPIDEVYAISAKSVSYAQRLFVDGKEIGTVGNPTDDAASFTPGNRRYVAGFYAQGEATEIIFHYSVFVHADGGGRFPMLVGSVEKVARAEQLRTLLEGVQAAMLLAALLFFFGLFLFFPGRRYLLWFALLCGCIGIGLLGANNAAVMLLLPEVSFTLYLRLSSITACCIGLTSALYLNGLFPGAAGKWAVGGFAAYCAAVCLFICTTPTTLFTRYVVPLSLSYVAFLVYLLAAIITATLQERLRSTMTKAEGFLLLGGITLYIVFTGVAIFAHQHSRLFFGWEYEAVGIMVFLFLNVLVLTLSFSRTEGALAEARLAEQEIRETNEMLARLDRLKDDFLANIIHEMNTPLAMISNCAGRTLGQFRRNEFDGETEENLLIIEDEAVRLGRLTEQLLDVSLERERQLTLTETDAGAVLRRAADYCAPICRSRDNRITVHTERLHIPMRVAEDNIFRVLINLITNANRQMTGGSITLSAAYEETMVVFTVTDQGSGIAPELLDKVFQRGVTGGDGKGLGLAICREIVEEHGGSIRIQNIGGGAQVRFTLPCKEEADGHEQ